MFSHDGPYSQTLRSCSRRLLFVGAMAACVVVSAMSGCTGNAAAAGDADTYRVEADVLYRTTDDLTESARGRCRLDVYYPTNTSGYATVVWFHGGGLTSGERFIPEELKRQGIAVVAANYRLAPDAASPTYIEDAAAAVAWTLRNIERFGGSAERVVLSGHSAGGYLAAMIGLDTR